MANKKTEWDHVGSSHVFRQRPPKKDDNGWVGALIVVVIVLALVSQCTG